MAQKPTVRRSSRAAPANVVGIQVPAGHILAHRSRWQTVLLAPEKPSIYRLHNEAPRQPSDRGNTMVVEVDGSKRPIQVEPGASVDVMGKRIRVKAGSGGDTQTVEGWFVLVS